MTKHYHPSIVDVENQVLLDGTVDDLRIGDELVFVKGTDDQDNDIVMDIIQRLLRNESFKGQYHEKLKLSKRWKSLLKDYMITNNYTASDIADCLEIFDVKRHPVTVSNWMNNPKIIGPTEKGIYYAIAQIVEDKAFQKNWEEVFWACDDIRKLHTRMKKYLGVAIVNRVTGIEGNDFDKMVEEVIGDLMQYAYVVQVEHVINESNQVPVYMTNKPIDV